MNKAILHKEVQEFLDVNLRNNLHSLLLKNAVFKEVSNKELVDQIHGKLKSKQKLPTWFEAKNIIFPPKISIEQTSSEETSRYKSSLISGKKIVDLTGGFGVDVFCFSKQFEEVCHCEINSELSKIAAHNFEQLGIKNTTFIPQDGMEFLKETDLNFDWIYLDPSRRDELKGKVFRMSDCLPDVPNNLNFLLSKSKNMMMKTSPLVDIKQGISELEFVKEIHVVAVKNEVKELLWIIEKGCQKEVIIKTINLMDSDSQQFQFFLNQESEIEGSFSLPKKYVFEPNSALLKSGGFNQIGVQNSLKKLHKHSHLYTSDSLIEFPGRRFKIVEIIPAKGKELKTKLKGTKANITTRNYPQKVEEIRKSLKIKEGGNVYLFFTTNLKDKKVCLVCEKV